MKAVHFGAGNIGRGFIGQLLHQDNAEITFIDVNESVIQALNTRKQYEVILAAKENEHHTVTNVHGINSQLEPERAVEAVASADIITTAVGPAILSLIAPLIQKGLLLRSKRTKQPVDVIACENMVGGSEKLKAHTFEQLDPNQIHTIESIAGFPNAAVDRIVPEQTSGDGLAVRVEPFYEWVIEESKVKRDDIRIPGALYVKELTPFIERKLFTVNTGHAAAAYVGFSHGYQTIADAMADDSVYSTVLGALKETGEMLTKKYPLFTKNEQKEYIEKVLTRFTNPELKDDVRRVGRTPLRKLGFQERLISPAIQLIERSGKPDYLLDVIVAALNYRNASDPEAVQLHEEIVEHGVEYVIKKHAQINSSNGLLMLICDRYRKMVN
ncbi:mannitol-1-phosphate 5-dehydrogenase [Alteribacter populi]|uniref:mannitol-1-phosphate 5-dehydrogenase n=1 Tax=Alteribacter populi TaxID=2011011 RepID=UPI000BBB63B8|nr:mannitol-1-phosphate 5-dehydrogenase [Alteribacter populi]